MIEKTKNPRFVWDSYRRLIQMYSDVVMEKAEGIEPEEGMGVRQQLERELAAMKKRRNAKLDVDLTDQDLSELAEIYKAKVQLLSANHFPMTPWSSYGARSVRSLKAGMENALFPTPNRRHSR